MNGMRASRWLSFVVMFSLLALSWGSGAAPSRAQEEMTARQWAVSSIPLPPGGESEALARLDPALRPLALSGSEEELLLWVLSTEPVEAERYGAVLAEAQSEGMGYRAFVRVSASRLLKLASVEGVVALISIAPKGEPLPPDPEAPEARPHGIALDAPPVVDEPLQKLHEGAHAVIPEVWMPQGTMAPVAPNAWFENQRNGVVSAWLAGVSGRGDPLDPVEYAVIDSGVDFCNLALYGRWAVQNSPMTPAYNGWPIAYDDHSAAEFIANYPAPGSGYGGNWGWYVNAGTGVAEGVFTDTLYGKNYTTPGTSKSGTYYYGYHPDSIWHLMTGYGSSPVILVADVATAGVYDTVYIDADWDGAFDTAMNRANPAGCVDWTGPGGSADGVPDDSYGLLYWISDGVSPLPGVDWIYGGGTPIPPSGRVVLLMINDIYAAGGDHGTLCASSAAGGEPPGRFYDWAGMLPTWFPPGTSIIGGPASGGGAAGAAIVAIGNTYAGGSPFNEYLFTLFGYDGMPASADDVDIVSLSFGSGSVDADAWDFQSEYLTYWNLQREDMGLPSPLYVNAAGNGGHGYGTVNTPAPATGLSVGASTQYGPYNVWGIYEGVSVPNHANFFNVQPWSNRGPTAMGHLAPSLVANGAWGSGAIPPNYATYVNGLDGAAAWDMWGGTSRATPVVAGMAALLYDAYWQGHGHYPDWRLARDLLMSSAFDIGYDELVAGSGQAQAYRTVLSARGDYGIYAEPAFYNAGSYPPGSGLRAESFSMGLLPGQTDVVTFTLYNPYTASVGVMIEDRQLQEVGRYTFTLSTLTGDPSPSNYSYGAPDYLLDLTSLVLAHSSADLMVVRDAYPFEHFAADPTQPPTYTNRWLGAVYNLFDDGDGLWWSDLNGNGRVEISPTVAAGSHELDTGDEYIRLTYAYLHGTMQELRVQHPNFWMGSGLWLGLSHIQSDSSATTHTVEVIFYEERDWPFLSVEPLGLFLPAATSSTPSAGVITATISTTVRLGSIFAETWDSAAAPALPPNWTTVDLSGSGHNWMTAGGTAHPPSGSPSTPPNLVYFDGYATSGERARLQQTSGIDLSAFPPGTQLELSFLVYHDGGFPTALDRLQVQLSTDGGTTWEDVGAPIYRVNGSSGWQEHRLDLSNYVGESDVRLGFLGLSDGGNDLHLDDVVLYQVERLAPGVHTAHILLHDPGVAGRYAPYELTLPIVVPVWPKVDDVSIVGGTEPAATPYDNGAVVGAFTWSGSQESGDWRIFPFILSNDLPVGSVLMVENRWEDSPTDIDTLLLERSPQWDFSSFGGGTPPYPPQWFGMHTMVDSGDGSLRKGVAPAWAYHTNGGEGREFLSAPAEAGLHVMLHEAVLYGGHQTAVPFTTTLAIASLTPNPVIVPGALHGTTQTVQLLFRSGLAFTDGLTMSRALGWYTPLVLTHQVVLQDDPNDPTTASWLYPIFLSDTYRLDVVISGATGPDCDLYVVRDVDMDGAWTTADSVVGTAATSLADEQLSLSEPPDGAYLIAVHGWNISPSPGSFDIRITQVAGDDVMEPVSLPTTVAAGETATLTLRLAEIPPRGLWEGLLLFGPPDTPTLFEVPVFIEEGGGSKSVDRSQAQIGEPLTFTIILTDATATTSAWHLEDPIPAEFDFLSAIGAMPITASGRTTLTWDSPLACQVNWLDATSGRQLTLDDDGEVSVTMPFTFTFYGQTDARLTVGNNGALLFGVSAGEVPSLNQPLASAVLSASLIAPFWDDLDDERGGVYVSVVGTPPHRRFVVEWEGRPHVSDVGAATFEVILEEGSNELYFLYRDTDFDNSAFDDGASATVGLRSRPATSDYVQYAYNRPVIDDNSYIHFAPTSPTSYTVVGSGVNCQPLHFGVHTVTLVLQPAASGVLTNTAIIRSGEAVAYRSASVDVLARIYLPCILRNH